MLRGRRAIYSHVQCRRGQRHPEAAAPGGGGGVSHSVRSATEASTHGWDLSTVALSAAFHPAPIRTDIPPAKIRIMVSLRTGHLGFD